MTFVVIAAFACVVFLWGAVESWLKGDVTSALIASGATVASAIVLIGFVYVLTHTTNPWAWIGLPMACRYTLRGC